MLGSTQITKKASTDRPIEPGAEFDYESDSKFLAHYARESLTASTRERFRSIQEKILQIAHRNGWLPLAGFLVLPWHMRLLLAALPFVLWVAEIIGWPAAPLWLLVLNGAQAGLGAGLFFCSIWPGLMPHPSE